MTLWETFTTTTCNFSTTNSTYTTPVVPRMPNAIRLHKTLIMIPTMCKLQLINNTIEVKAALEA